MVLWSIGFGQLHLVRGCLCFVPYSFASHFMSELTQTAPLSCVSCSLPFVIPFYLHCCICSTHIHCFACSIQHLAASTNPGHRCYTCQENVTFFTYCLGNKSYYYEFCWDLSAIEGHDTELTHFICRYSGCDGTSIQHKDLLKDEEIFQNYLTSIQTPSRSSDFIFLLQYLSLPLDSQLTIHDLAVSTSTKVKAVRGDSSQLKCPIPLCPYTTKSKINKKTNKAYVNSYQLQQHIQKKHN